MKYQIIVFLFILFYVEYSKSANCVGSTPTLEELSIVPRVSYWYADVQYGDESGDIVGFGAVSSTTGESVTTYVTTYYNFRIFKSGDYDFFFTYNIKGLICNLTTTMTVSVPTIDIVQPKCYGTNATFTVNYESDNFTLTSLSNTNKVIASFGTNTFSLPIFYPGEYKMIISSSDFVNLNGEFPVSLAFQNGLYPKFELYPYSFSNQTIKIINYNSYTNIQFIDRASGQAIEPVSPGVYSYLSTSVCDFIFTSGVCGVQNVSTLTLPTIPDLVSSYHQISSCEAINLNVSFVISNADPADFSLTINNDTYEAGSMYMTTYNSDITVVASQSNVQFTYKYKTPGPFITANYTILQQPTCNSNGTAKILFPGNSSLVTVNQLPIASDYTFPIQFGKNYKIQTECSQSSISLLAGLGLPKYQFLQTETNSCFGKLIVIIQNFNEYKDVIVMDGFKNVNYTSTDGVFTLPPTFMVYFYYKICDGADYIKSDTIPMNLFFTPVGSTSDITVKYNYDNNICSVHNNYTIDIFYLGRYLSTKTLIKGYPGNTVFIDLPNTCGFTMSKFPDVISTSIPYQILKPATCRDSLATVQFLPNVDNVYYLSLDGVNVAIEPSINFTYQLKAGRHSAKFQISNSSANCYSIFDFDIPFENDKNLTYSIVKQSSNQCDTPNGQIKVDNFDQFNSLLLNGEYSNKGVFSNLMSNSYVVNFNHTFCGVGTLNIDVGTDGQFHLVEIQPNTCPDPNTANGVYQPYVVTANGTISSKFDGSTIPSGTYDTDIGLFRDVPPGQLIFSIANQNCLWDYNNTVTGVNVGFSLNLTGSVNYLTATGYDSILTSNYSKVRIDSVSDGYYTYPSGIIKNMVIYGNQINLVIKYDNKCTARLQSLINLEATLGLDVVGTKCGSMDLQIRFTDQWVKTYDIRSPFGDATSPPNNTIKFISTYPIYFQRKLDGYQSYFNLPNYVGQAASLPNPIVTVTNESCVNSGDGSVVIEDYDPVTYGYYLFSNSIAYPVSGASISGLSSGQYYIYTILVENPICIGMVQFKVGAKVTVVTPKIILNQCKVGVNSTIKLTTTVDGVPATNIYRTINSTVYENDTISLSSGLYYYSVIQKNGSCYQGQTGTIEIPSYILNTKLSSPVCSTARIVISGYQASTVLTTHLYNVTSGINKLVGIPSNDYMADFPDLKNGTYKFIVTDATGCQVESETIDIIECPIPTVTPTPTDINNSNRLSPKYVFCFIFFILFTILI